MTLLRAFEVINKKITCELLLIGYGVNKAKIQNFISENKLESKIKILNYQTNPYKFIKRDTLNPYKFDRCIVNLFLKVCCMSCDKCAEPQPIYFSVLFLCIISGLYGVPNIEYTIVGTSSTELIAEECTISQKSTLIELKFLAKTREDPAKIQGNN